MVRIRHQPPFIKALRRRGAFLCALGEVFGNVGGTTSTMSINPWKLDPKLPYHLSEDAEVDDIMAQLGVADLFDEVEDEEDVQAFVAFDNHPTHWMVFSIWKGPGAPSGSSLLFEAIPKTTKRAAVEDDLKSRLPEESVPPGAYPFEKFPRVKA
jgi:hypothetical protein